MSDNFSYSTSKYAIIAKDLRKYYRKSVRGLRDGFSCRISKGDNTVLLGSNGAGKTTLLNVIANIKFPDCGTVYINGVNWRKPESRASLRYLPEDVLLPPKCNIMDILKEYQALNGRITTNDVEKMSEVFNCRDQLKRKFKNMSKGQKRLMLLALILSGQPDIVILDEPMEGLDPLNIHKVRKRIKELCKTGTTVLQSTHRVHEAERHGGNFLIIHDGKYITEGELASISEYCKISIADNGETGVRSEDIIMANENTIILEKTKLGDLGLLSDSHPESSPVTLEDIYLCSVN